MINDTSKEFIRRHIGPSEKDMDKMLKLIGANSLDDLIKKTVPEEILLKDKLKIHNTQYTIHKTQDTIHIH
jgi:glycine dehydrogenase